MATDNSAFSTVQPNTVPRADNPYIDALAQVNKWSSNTTISFFLKGTWAGFESTAAQQAFQLFSNVANIKFQQVFTEAETNLILTKENKDKDDPDTLGRFNFPDADAVATNQITGIFYTEASGWNVDGLLQGGNGFVTLIHEIGHALGLAHPHDDGGGSSLFPGVVESEDLGTNALNQGVWTTMSYNDGLVANGLGSGSNFGYQGSLMSFDIAAIQHIYGANTNYNSGSNVYTLPTSNTSGTYYQSIWDTGGNDTINASGASSIVTINLNAASLTGDDAGGFISSVSDVFGGYTIANGVTIENATGGSGDDILTGNDVDNKLDGGGGADTLIGGLGNDVYIVDNQGDTITENAAEGTDRVESSVTYTLAILAINVENLNLTGTDNIDGTGNFQNNVITGNTGNNTLNGSGGVDTLIGGLGDDVYIVNTTTDIITENASQGTDRVESSVTFSLAAIANVENLTLTGTGNINGTGNSLDNRILGNSGNNTLLGGAGADTLDGRGGIDTLIGGADNDTYIVDSTTDTITENASEGTDRVDSSVTFSLAAIANVENPTLTGTNNIDGTGNALDNVITGNIGNNTLNGGGGVDTLIGGLGDDVYIVDTTTDIITENAAQGTDRIESSVTFTLVPLVNVENLTLTGNGDIDGTGNLQSNVIKGNVGNNILKGGANSDSIDGGAGVDTVSYDDSTSGTVVNIDENNDYTNAYSPNIAPFSFNITKGKAQDGFGTTDTLTNIENITGSNFSDVLIGNEVDNVIRGLAGNDLLIGNGGLDTLEGGTGNDSFFGGKGNDIIDGGANIDTVIYDNSDNGVTVNIDETTDYTNTKVGIDIEPTFSITKGKALDGFGDTDTLKNLENITGSKSNDVLIGNEFQNTILGLAGDDLFIGNKGNDTLDGGDGIDTVSYRREPSRVIVDLSKQTATDGFGSTDTLLNIENVVGSKFDDEITGDAKVNKIIAGEGKDIVTGGAGDDLLYGEADNDTISGGLDKDFIDGGTGDDILKGEAGQDTILGGTDNDELFGGTENDDLNGNAGNDKLFGEANDDLLKGESGNDLIDGGTEIDTVSYDNSPKGVVVNIDEAQSFQAPGGILRQTVFVTSIIPTDLEQKFTIASGSAQDGFGTTDTLRNLENIIGSGFNDVLIGNSSFNRLQGLAGDDVFISSVSDDFFDGGADIDTASYRRDPSAVNVSLEQNKATDGFGNTDQLFNIENVIGTAFSDRIVGDAKNNIIFAGADDDIVNARDGNDILFGEAGKDNLFGENGDDLLDGGDGDDQLDGSDGNDIIRGGLGIDTAIYNGRRSRYSITRINGGFTITSNDTGEGVDTVSYDVEKLQFSDQVVAINPAIPKLNNDVFTVINGSKAKPSVQFTVNSNGANQLGELGVFVVDDADGKIDGIAPNDNGYAQKALSKAKVIFSVLDNSPSGFSINGLSRLLEFNKSDKFRFYAIGDRATTTDSVLASGNFSKVNFSTATLLNFNENDGGSFINFNNLSINVKPSDDELPIGTGLQDQKEGEVLDLTKGFDTKVFSQVKADFTVNREAGFNNFVGFYKIENAKGDIKRADGSIVSVGQSGYIQAAVAGQVSGIDLSVDNQSTKTTSGVFSAGSIFAPFIIVNGNRDAILDNNPSNDPAVYFSFLGANSDKVDHIRLLGNNTFGFEDLAGGGDFDYNDIIVKVKLTPVA